MGIHPKTERKTVPKKKKRLRTIITAQLKLQIIEEFHGQGMAQSRIAEKYGMHRDTVAKIIREDQHDPNVFQPFNPNDILKRVDLGISERIDLISKDAAQTVELTLAAIICKLRHSFAITENNEDRTSNLAMGELTRFLDTAMQYVLPKKENKAVPKGENKPAANIHQLFKKQVS